MPAAVRQARPCRPPSRPCSRRRTGGSVDAVRQVDDRAYGIGSAHDSPVLARQDRAAAGIAPAIQRGWPLAAISLKDPDRRPARVITPRTDGGRMTGLTFQDIIMRLDAYWAAQGCLVVQPYDVEVGAGTAAPSTFLRVLGPEPWSVAYPQPSRRPADGRYAENPNRYQHYFQYQVILKPAPADPLGPVPGEPGGARRQRQRPRRPLRRGQLGGAVAGLLGARLGGLARRPGDHPVHLLPAERRLRPRSAVGRDHLRPGAHRDVPPGRARHGRRSAGTTA